MMPRSPSTPGPRASGPRDTSPPKRDRTSSARSLGLDGQRHAVRDGQRDRIPGRQAIALCGDGGLSMLMGDLLTIAERNPSQAGRAQQLTPRLRAHRDDGGRDPAVRNKFKNPNSPRWLSSLGISPDSGWRDPSDVRSTVDRFLATPGPALLDAVVATRTPSAYPPTSRFGEAEGFSLGLGQAGRTGQPRRYVIDSEGNVHLRPQ